MKINNRFLTVIGAALVLFSSNNTVGATEIIEVNTVEESKTIRMELNTPAAGAIRVTLFNDNERIVYADQISAGDTFADEFDFSSFDSGTYKLVSELGNMRLNQYFRVNDKAVTSVKNYYSFIPQFRLEGNTLLVHYINHPQDNIAISIESSRDVLYDSFYGDPEGVFKAAYDLEYLPSETYTIHLISGGEFFSHAFKVE